MFHNPDPTTPRPLTLAGDGPIAELGGYFGEAFADLGRDGPGGVTPSWGGQAVMSNREPCAAGKPSGGGDTVVGSG